MLTHLEIEKMYNDALEPYARELGLLLHDWNDLHIKITYLFLAVCSAGNADDKQRDILLSVWNAIPNDRLQRQMLKNAAKVRFGRIAKTMEEIGVQIDVILDNEKRQLDEILWILTSADVLGRKRDDSAHVPMMLHVSDTLQFFPMDHLGHPIAEQLSGENMLGHFALYRARIQAVSKHASDMWFFLIGNDKQPTLPQRPAWPTLPQSSERKA